MQLPAKYTTISAWPVSIARALRAAGIDPDTVFNRVGLSLKALEQAQAAFDDGEYRWTVELLNRLVFAEPGHKAAKALLAKTYDQLGYQAESAPMLH